MRILGVIPARGGSKGVPRKNIRPLAGTPLLVHTINAARGSKLTRTVVSTEDAEIAEVAKAAGGDVPFIRPDALATDKALAIPTIRQALDKVEALEGGEPYDAVMMLQPTTPLSVVTLQKWYSRQPASQCRVSTLAIFMPVSPAGCSDCWRDLRPTAGACRARDRRGVCLMPPLREGFAPGRSEARTSRDDGDGRHAS
mgnify:CR=1 FL=1